MLARARKTPSAVELYGVSASIAKASDVTVSSTACGSAPCVGPVSPGAGAIWDLEVWPDENETFLLNADGSNNEVRILSRESGGTVGSFGRNGRMAGDFHWIHYFALDSKGNVFTTEVDNGKRAQKFLFKGDTVLRKRSAN